MVLLVFAGSAAEFALNRAVDWLFFTGKLPRDPIGRLFSTAAYAQQIVFADASTASRTLDRIRAAHEAVERQRGQRIPDWAHRDVLYMLIDYSERAHEMLARPLSPADQDELYDVFHRVGTGLGIPGLPPTYTVWRADRALHLRRDLLHGDGTEALYGQYRNHLGPWRYHLLLRIQSILTPEHVRGLLRLRRAGWLRPVLRFHPILVRAGLRSIVQQLLMPSSYLPAVRALDHPAASCPRGPLAEPPASMGMRNRAPGGLGDAGRRGRANPPAPPVRARSPG
ncbi:MAG TPA: oxygenase MpaB family protein [Thermoanaerobaculia bacterium]|nr:oxygenase MpaB family protein [Thermoanaerobaculia bacterium]